MKRLPIALLALLPWAAFPAESSFLEDAQRDPGRWPELCRQWRKVEHALGGAPKFSAKPARSNRPDWWKLRWQGLDVPVPKGDYRDLLLPGENTGPRELILRGEGVMVALMVSTLDAPMGKPVSKLSGESFSIGEAILAAYYGGAITCTMEKRRHEMRALAGLPPARIGGPFNQESVYPGVGANPGWLETGTNKNGLRQWRAVTLGRLSAPGVQVEVVVPDKPAYAGIGLAIGVPDARSLENPPPWLSDLQRALDEGSRESWLGLRRTLQEAGFSERSLKGINTVLPSMDGK